MKAALPFILRSGPKARVTKDILRSLAKQGVTKDASLTEVFQQPVRARFRKV
jgi:hypothetical protein